MHAACAHAARTISSPVKILTRNEKCDQNVEQLGKLRLNLMKNRP